jgi:hypothetical protein
MLLPALQVKGRFASAVSLGQIVGARWPPPCNICCMFLFFRVWEINLLGNRKNNVRQTTGNSFRLWEGSSQTSIRKSIVGKVRKSKKWLEYFTLSQDLYSQWSSSSSNRKYRKISRWANRNTWFRQAKGQWFAEKTSTRESLWPGKYHFVFPEGLSWPCW